MRGLVIVLGFVQVFLAVSLIFIISIQETKNEGLGGTIGGRVSTSFKGLPGFEERLTLITRNLSIGFFITSIIVAIIAGR